MAEQERVAADALVGLGRPGPSARAARRGARLSRGDRRSGVLPRARRSRWRTFACPRPSLSARRHPHWERSSARRTCAQSTPNACCTPPARAIPTSCACAPGSHVALRTRSCWRAPARRLARCSRCALASRWPSCRSAAGRASSAASSRCAASSAASSRWTCATWGRCSRWTRRRARSRVQGGIRAPALERHLAKRGLTLGHYPQSFEYVSLGGCAATRSAGQASSGYGAIERMVQGMRAVAPAGTIDLPAHAGQRRRAFAAPVADRLGGHARRDLRAVAARARRALPSIATRASSSRTSRPERRSCARLPSRAPRPTSRACQTSRRRACRWRSPARAG